MKILKYLGLGLLFIVALLLVVGLFIDKRYSVKREIVIEKPRDEVFDYIKYLKNQDNYSKWQLIDPNMKKTFTGTDGQVGFVAAWESDNEEVGKGEQEIKAIFANERVEYILRFKEPFESTESTYMSTEAVGNGTKVTWGFNGEMDYPMNLMFVFMNFEEMIGNDLSTGLENLKKLLEAQPAVFE